MQATDVKRTVHDLWNCATASWRDEMAKKYKTAAIDEMERLLQSMQSASRRLQLAGEEALERLKDIRD